jgi:hypothetical protein
MVARSLARLTAASTPGRRLSTFSSLVEQAAQLMPLIAISIVCSGTAKPACSIAATTCPAVVSAPVIATCARSVARLTLALTPGMRFSTRSMRPAQAAQLMPLIGRSSVCGLAEGSLMAPPANGRVPSGPQVVIARRSHG